MENRLADVWIDNFHLYVEASRFDSAKTTRSVDKVVPPKKNNVPQTHVVQKPVKPPVIPSPVVEEIVNNGDKQNDGQSYASKVSENHYQLPLGGLRFTYRNKAGSKLSKLDRFFLSNNLLSVVDDIKGSVLSRGYSDHSPIFLFQDKVDFGPTYFKIFDSWFDRTDFDVTVRSAWDSICTTRDLDIVAKLRIMKSKLKAWIHQSRSFEASRVMLRNKLFNERYDLLALVNSDAIQKARVKWDVEGDENSKFFHAYLKRKRSVQQIHGLMVNGVWVDDPNDVKNTFFEFFKSKFDAFDTDASCTSISPNYVLSSDEVANLERDIDDAEIKRAVCDCGSFKAPGPDGMSFRFIKHFWDILQHDLCRDIRLFFTHNTMPHGAKSAFFSLIPKIANPTVVTDFRPISLVGFFYKIISKILTNRLLHVIDKVISPVQSAFIAGRQILDGPMMLSEIISSYK
ncbi:uncharacterized protein [Rutidosis leptorrhynchoides]|uniref:uncharacterized protein n=1 Tax=Rutidosis leptorrhynchoides TaxID=125765 RepID=UPI003A99972E